MSQDVSNADFGTGILVGLAALGITEINTSRLDSAAVKAFDELATVEDANLRFYMKLNSLHGDAPEAKRAIGGAMARGLGHFDSDGILHIDVSQDSADSYFKHLPLTAENWKTIAKVALSHLRGE